MSAKIKKTVTMTQETLDALQEIAALEGGITMGEALRDIIRRERYILDQVKNNEARIIIERGDQMPQELIF